jgi:hypothetical protein
MCVSTSRYICIVIVQQRLAMSYAQEINSGFA